MSKIYGVAKIAGLSLNITWTSIPTDAVVRATGATHSHQWDETVTRDPATNVPIGFLVNDERDEFEIEGIATATGTSGHNTKTLAAGALEHPAPYTIVTLSGMVNTTRNTTYLYAGGWDVSYTPEGDAKVKFRIRRYAELDSAAHTALATVAS